MLHREIGNNKYIVHKERRLLSFRDYLVISNHVCPPFTSLQIRQSRKLSRRENASLEQGIFWAEQASRISASLSAHCDALAWPRNGLETRRRTEGEPPQLVGTAVSADFE